MGGDLTNNCPLQLLMTYQSARNTQKNPKHFIIILCYIFKHSASVEKYLHH